MSEKEVNITEEIWAKALDIVRASFDSDTERRQWERYYPSFLTHGVNGGEYVIGVAESTMVEWFTPKYAKSIEMALTLANGGNGLPVVFKVDSEAAKKVAPYNPEAIEQKDDSEKPKKKILTSTLPLTESYTFDNFVKGPSNSFAHAAAKAVAKLPGDKNYNPLFIYGDTGLGKTHLMQAIGHEVLQNNPSLSVCYLTSETFLNEYVNALTEHELEKFRQRYRKVDVLLIDDVQFMADKEKIQEEFFNTFGSLMLYQKQVVMTCDVPPRDLKGLEDRLTGRFAAGMVVEIESPSYETRLAILKFKAKKTNHEIPAEILQFIADNIYSHVRAIEGALNLVVTFMDLNKDMPLTVEIVRHLLRDYIEEEENKNNLTVADVLQATSQKFGVSIADIKSESRLQNLVVPRQVAMFLCYKFNVNSLPGIGKEFNRTHATVYHGIQSAHKRAEMEKDCRQKIEEIIVALGRKPSEVFE